MPRKKFYFIRSVDYTGYGVETRKVLNAKALKIPLDNALSTLLTKSGPLFESRIT